MRNHAVEPKHATYPWATTFAAVPHELSGVIMYNQQERMMFSAQQLMHCQIRLRFTRSFVFHGFFAHGSLLHI
jgi:hypothetical protein